MYDIHTRAMVPNHDKPYLEYANLLVLREGISLANQSFYSSTVETASCFDIGRHIGKHASLAGNME